MYAPVDGGQQHNENKEPEGYAHTKAFTAKSNGTTAFDDNSRIQGIMPPKKALFRLAYLLVLGLISKLHGYDNSYGPDYLIRVVKGCPKSVDEVFHTSYPDAAASSFLPIASCA